MKVFRKQTKKFAKISGTVFDSWWLPLSHWQTFQGKIWPPDKPFLVDKVEMFAEGCKEDGRPNGSTFFRAPAHPTHNTRREIPIGSNMVANVIHLCRNCFAPVGFIFSGIFSSYPARPMGGLAGSPRASLSSLWWIIARSTVYWSARSRHITTIHTTLQLCRL